MMINQNTIALCALDDLAEGESKGIQADNLPRSQSVFLIKKNDEVFGYINSCPHTGAPLEWMPDQFLSLDKEQIQCALHGARFNIEDGLCVSGPCTGASLTPIDIELSEEGMLVWNPRGLKQ